MAAAATPEAGFADGDGVLARFDGPSGLAAAEDGTVFVADTNNHLVNATRRAMFLVWPLYLITGGVCASARDRCRVEY